MSNSANHRHHVAAQEFMQSLEQLEDTLAAPGAADCEPTLKQDAKAARVEKRSSRGTSVHPSNPPKAGSDQDNGRGLAASSLEAELEAAAADIEQFMNAFPDRK